MGTEIKKEGRLDYIDAVKAIAMISVVLFHACTNNPNTYLATNAYLIRITSAYALPVFFFINGFLYHNKNIDNPVKEIWRKTKSYYGPFLAYNLIYLAFHNLFVYLHMVNADYGNGYYNLKDYAKHFVLALTGHREFFSNALWFLGSIFMMNAGVIILEYLIHKLLKDRFYTELFSLAALCSMVLGNLSFVPEAMKIRSTFAYFIYFFFGMVYKKYKLNDKVIKIRPVLIIVGIVIDLAISYNKLYNPFSINKRIAFIALDYLNGLICIVAIMLLCQYALIRKSKLLKVVGNNTLHIMGLHFMVFKIVSLLIIKLDGLPIDRLAEHPVLVGVEGYWWILYTIVGITISTILSIAINNITGRGKKRGN